MRNKINVGLPDWDFLAGTIYRQNSRFKDNCRVFFKRVIRILSGQGSVIDIFQKAVTSSPPEQLDILRTKFFTLFDGARLNKREAVKVCKIRRDLGLLLPTAIPASKQELVGCRAPSGLLCPPSVALATHLLPTKPAVTPYSANSDIQAGIAELPTQPKQPEIKWLFSHETYVHKLEKEFLVVDVPADGDCFFYALAHQIYPEMVESGQGRAAMLKVRKEIADYMALPGNRADFAAMMEPGVNFDHYLEVLSFSSRGKDNREGWGGQPELIAAAQRYRRPAKMFVFYGQQKQEQNASEPYQEYSTEFQNRPLYMLFNGVNHWEAMIPLRELP